MAVRWFLVFVVALLVSGGRLAEGWAQEAAGESAEPPNIVLVLIDDMGWSDLGCYGNQFHETPYIDRLAEQGVRFTDFYAACPVCSPTRASIQAGQYQARFSLTDFIPGHWRPFEKLVVPPNASHLPLEIETVAETLQSAGYQTGYYGKWHLGNNTDQGPSAQGYDEAIVTGGGHFAPFRTTPKTEVGEGRYLGDFLTDQTIAFIERNHKKPFFVQLSHYAVHIPLQAKPEKIDYYKQKTPIPGKVNNPIYAAMVAHVDESVGKIVAALERMNLTENTMVVVTSDNGGLYNSYRNTSGPVMNNDPLRGEKGTLYEGGIRVPLIVRWPGVAQAGGVCDEPTISIDFYRTFADAAGADLPDQPNDGLSLVKLLKDPEATLNRDAIYFHYPHYHHSTPAGAVRSGDWKLIEFFDTGKYELYDLTVDVGETTNVAAARPEEVNELRAMLANWQNEVGAKMPTENAKFDAARAGEWWSRRTQKPFKTKAEKSGLLREGGNAATSRE